MFSRHPAGVMQTVRIVCVVRFVGFVGVTEFVALAPPFLSSCYTRTHRERGVNLELRQLSSGSMYE